YSFFSTLPPTPPTHTLSLHDALPISPEELARRGRTLRAGDRLSWAETAAWLFDLGYEPVTEVSEPGTFSRRVGIIDIYPASAERSEEHTSELQSLAYLVCRLLLEKKK